MSRFGAALTILFFVQLLPSCAVHPVIPEPLRGSFTDDYDIEYQITDSVWLQYPGSRYHIVEHNAKAQFIIARNDPSNPSAPGKYTRIDYMFFENMAPFDWGFCLTVYKANSIDEAKSVALAQRQNPKKGCNGFPFSRMKPNR